MILPYLKDAIVAICIYRTSGPPKRMIAKVERSTPTTCTVAGNVYRRNKEGELGRKVPNGMLIGYEWIEGATDREIEQFQAGTKGQG